MFRTATVRARGVLVMLQKTSVNCRRTDPRRQGKSCRLGMTAYSAPGSPMTLVLTWSAVIAPVQTRTSSRTPGR